MNIETITNSKERFYSYQDFLDSLNNDEVDTQRALEIFETRHNILRKTVFPENFNQAFMPYYGNDVIELPYVNGEMDSIQRIQSDYAACGFFPPVEDLPMVFHPHMFENGFELKQSGVVNGIISSSTRTLFLQDELRGLCIKTHLPVHIGPFKRGLSASSVGYSVAINDYLFSRLDIFPAGAYFLPEFAGSVCWNSSFDVEGKGIGCLYRSLFPISVTELPNRFGMIPMFSLYTPIEEGEYFLTQMLDQNMLLDNVHLKYSDALIHYVIDPYLKNWFWFMQNLGIILEPHGQNALLLVNEDGRNIGFAYRDFQALRVIDSANVSEKFRNRLSKHLLVDEDAIRDSLSLVYDTYICDFLFRHLVAICAKADGVDVAYVENQVREIFRKYSGMQGGLFHSEKVRPAQKNNFALRFEGDAILETCGKSRYR